MWLNVQHKQFSVHGDIRHLEMIKLLTSLMILVHGDIRHLEIQK